MMDEILLEFPEEIRRILKDLIDYDDEELILHPNGKNLIIESAHGTCYSWELTLQDVSGLPEQAEDGWTLLYCGLGKEENRYVLMGTIEHTDSYESIDMELRFSNLSVAYTAHRAEMNGPGVKPWAILSALAYQLVRKNEVVPQLMNMREKELLPLLKEIAMVSYWSGEEQPAFPLLRQRLDPKVYPALDRVEKTNGDWKKHWKAKEKLLAQLDMQIHEPAWRQIYNEIAASQEAYPQRCSPSADTRSKVENLLYQWGYRGKYPDFIKSGAVRGLHVRDSHGMSYFIFNEKNAVFHIHCREYPEWNDTVQIEFLCGTEFLKQDEQPGDIWSCMFNAMGRRLIYSVSCFTEEDLPAKAAIAVKKAELLKLTKEEQKNSGGANLLSLFLLFFLFAGGFFAVFWTLGFSLLCMLITGISAGWSEIPELIHTLPWIEMFVMCWVGFGGAMGIVCVIAERNK